ncbi:MAG: hypothetical protein SFY95_03990 [Planctomycetota bacterium]|nr:hypothetical protein [Planctomycetota bacterium]
MANSLSKLLRYNQILDQMSIDVLRSYQVQDMPPTIKTSGKQLRAAWQRIRPVRQRGAKGAVTLAAVSSKEIALCGTNAEARVVGASAESAPFSVLIPAQLFEQLVLPDPLTEERLVIQFAEGSMRINDVVIAANGMKITYPDRAHNAMTQPSSRDAQSSSSLMSEPLDLLEHQSADYIYYHYHLVFPGSTPGSPTLLRLLRDAEKRLTRACSALKPLGIHRPHLEQILRDRYAK